MRKIVKPSYDNGKNKSVRTTTSGITRRRPRSIRKGEPSWKIYYDTEEEYLNAMKSEEQLRQKLTQLYLLKKDREAAKADRLFGSLRSANNAAAELINKPVISKKQIKQALEEQEEKNINTWKPALNTVDLGVNLVSLLRPNPYMYAGSMLWDAFQMGDDIATGDVPINSTASLLFDGIGYAGATNRLRPITIRIPRSRSTSGLPRSHQMTINTDKVADVTGTGFNVLDSSNDVYGIGKFGLNYANTQNPNLMFKPFSYRDGKDNTERFDEKKGTWRMTNDQVISGTAFRKGGKVYIDQGDGNIIQVDDSDHVIYPLQYASSFNGSLDNTLNTLDVMTGGTISMAPVLGDVLDGLNVLNDVNKGNYANAGIGLSLLALPNFIEKPLSKGKKLFNLSKNFIKNKAKAVNDFIGEGSAFLAYKYPNILTGKYKGNKYLDDTIDKFYKEDVYGRYKKALYNPELNRNLPKELRDEYENIIGKNGNPSEIRTYLGSGDMLSFVSRDKPKYIFARKSQLKNPDKAGQIIVHEGNHSQTGLLKKFIKRREGDLNYDINTTEFGGYAADDALNKAYNFSDEAYKKVNSPIDEKAATNREIRFDLFKRTGKTGNELDEVIDNLSDLDLKNLLSNLKSYYRRQFLKNFKPDTADYMRKALKIVPATLPIAIGASLYNDRDVDPDYNYKKGKDDHKYFDYIIYQSMLGNPTAKRMTGEDDRYIPAFGPGDRSNIVLGSYGNYATPSVMNIGGELMYTPNPWEVFPEWMVQNQSFKFNNPNDAIDFAENYKYSSPAFPEFFGVDNSVNYNKGKDSGIHIKKKNRGKFTAAAKRAGMGVQAYARKILNAPKGKYSSTLRKRANFAANAAKWHK